MKKNKIIFLVFLIICFPLCFFACNEKQVQLSTPYSIGYVVNDQEGSAQLLLVTDANPNATQYEFFISDSIGQNKVFLSYTSTFNFLDVTNIFTDQKEYSFYVRYIGSKKYKTSNPSETKTFNANIKEVTTPSLQLNGTNLNWFKITYATGYEIYETVKNADGSIKNTETKIATLDSSTYSYNFSSRLSSQSPYYKYSYRIKALGGGFYSNSSNSNIVEYIQNIKLETPKNLSVSKNSENKIILTYSPVTYATKYKVIVNDDLSKSFETADVSCDVTSYVTNYASFFFNVQAIESNAIEYEESNTSTNVEFQNTIKLIVSDLNCSRNGENIVISFTGHELASNGYTLSIKYSGFEIYKDASFSLDPTGSKTILIPNEINVESATVTISVKANAVSDYILESDFISINYTFEKV